MTKLNQIIAISASVKNNAKREQTDLFRAVQKPALLSGITREYQPVNDNDVDTLPREATSVQITVQDVLDGVGKSLTRLFDVTLTQETANASAKADVVVEGDVLLKNVPVTYLLFLEKQLVDLNTFVRGLPVLDPASVWTKDENTGVYTNEPVKTVRTKKVPRVLVRAEATDKHPAQTEVYHEDVKVGEWTKRDFSGSVPLVRKQELLERVEKLQASVKFAREEANSTEVVDQKAGEKVFKFLFS